MFKREKVQELISDRPQVSIDHKCWFCVWGTFLGDRFYCPFPKGVCFKR